MDNTKVTCSICGEEMKDHKIFCVGRATETGGEAVEVILEERKYKRFCRKCRHYKKPRCKVTGEYTNMKGTCGGFRGR